MKDFRELKVWEKGHQLVLSVYRATGKFPKDELYGLTGQIRRASASIPANIAEGCGREGDAELARFLQIARGSASELEYHLLLSRDLGFLSTEEHTPLSADTTEIKRMLTSFIQTLKNHPKKLTAES
ncbi:MAG: four helix bundle protein [Chloroflexi bacterium]|nr:four helix bundle protein [Chloroflexota bacterium]